MCFADFVRAGVAATTAVYSNDAIISSKGVVCLNINVRNFVGTFVQQKGAFIYSVDPDETPHNAASHQGRRSLPCYAHSW